MKRPLVSVVLPIYNVEKYLENCIQSVINQTYHNLEILLIEDGSPDNCPRICDAWAKKDSRIRVIHKKNAGLGMARNTGIENATGEYICFFDSDDYIREDTVEKAAAKMVAEQADLAVFGFSRVKGTGELLSTFIPAVGERTYRGQEVRDVFLPDYIAPDHRKTAPRALYLSAWSAMYSMETIRRSGWRFVSEREIIAEDVYSLIDFVQYVRTVTVIPEAFYFYRINEMSLSRSYQPGRYQKIKHFYQETMNLCCRADYNEDALHRVSKPYLAFTLAALKQEAAGVQPFKQKMKNIRMILGDVVLQQVLQQNRRDAVSITRRIIFFFMRTRQNYIVFLLLKLKSYF